jgi:tetratricopeptide (TPR) repeat protein
MARLKFISLMVFILLALGAIGVVVLLPEKIDRQIEKEAFIPKQQEPASQPVDEGSESDVVQARAKIEAERLLGELLSQQTRLESEGIKVWGEQRLVTSYPDALARLAEGDAHFNRRQYDLAVEAYLKTKGLFDQLAASRPKRLEQSLRTGIAALERLDDEIAKQEFQIALSIDSQHAIAQNGLRRAQNLPRLLAQIEQGQAFESSGDYKAAYAAYAEAVALDAEYRPAQEHLSRIDGLLRAQNYKTAISKSLLALEQHHYAEARQHLAAARKLKADALEVSEIAQRLSAAEQNSVLEGLRQKAMQHEKSENWGQAIATYDEALRVGKNAVFAIDGQARAKQREALYQQLDYYLLQPERLQSTKPLAHAQKLLDVVLAIEDAGQQLRSKRDRLRALIDASQIEVAIVLRSDEKTDVTLYRTGHLGRFIEHRLMLRPGSYTAVGTRVGYRDVRVTFNVPLSGSAATILIRCEEQI